MLIVADKTIYRNYTFPHINNKCAQDWVSALSSLLPFFARMRRCSLGQLLNLPVALLLNPNTHTISCWVVQRPLDSSRVRVSLKCECIRGS
jgi:hypothetical protein